MLEDFTDAECDIAQTANEAVFNAMKAVMVENRTVSSDVLISMIVSGAAHGLAAFAHQCAPDPTQLRGTLGEACEQALAEMKNKSH